MSNSIVFADGINGSVNFSESPLTLSAFSQTLRGEVGRSACEVVIRYMEPLVWIEIGPSGHGGVSAYERAEAYRLRSVVGAVVFKPQHRDDMSEVFTALGVSTAASFDRRVEPDFIYREVGNSRVPVVCELAGYEAADHEAYHRRLEDKEAHYRRPGQPWKYRRVIGANTVPPTSISGLAVNVDHVVLSRRSRSLLLAKMVETFSE